MITLKKALIYLAIGFSFAQAMKANAAPNNQIAAGSIVCFTESGYDAQMKALAQGVEKTIKECGLAGKAIPVIVLKSNIFSASKVRAIDGGMILWVGVESIEVRK
jgi:hypothetical protein